MVDYAYGVQKAHGYTATGFAVTGGQFEFITITTAVPILTYQDWIAANAQNPLAPTTQEVANATASQASLDKLIQIVSLRGQPIVMGKPVTATANGATSYTLTYANEHAAAWAVTATSGSVPSFTDLHQPWPDARTGEDLIARIKYDGVNFGFKTDNTLAISFSTTLV